MWPGTKDLYMCGRFFNWDDHFATKLTMMKMMMSTSIVHVSISNDAQDTLGEFIKELNS